MTIKTFFQSMATRLVRRPTRSEFTQAQIELAVETMAKLPDRGVAILAATRKNYPHRHPVQTFIMAAALSKGI